jgi:hypothetical protein
LPDHHGHAFADAVAYPNARLLRMMKYGLEPVTVRDTDHYKIMREFCDDPTGFVEGAMELSQFVGRNSEAYCAV